MQRWDDLVSRIKHLLTIVVGSTSATGFVQKSQRGLTAGHASAEGQPQVGRSRVARAPGRRSVARRANGILPGGFGNRRTRRRMIKPPESREQRIPSSASATAPVGHRGVRAKCGRPDRRRLRSATRKRRPNSPEAARPAGRGRSRRHDAPRQYACQLTTGSLAERVYGARLGSRTPSPSLRVQLNPS